MKILLIGKNGQIGRELQRTLMTLGELIAVGRESIDLSQPDTIRQNIREIQPHLIVNAAAYTMVDKAEAEADLAMTINGTAPGIIAEEAKLLGAKIIHYSTDYVFDGNRDTPYTEADLPNPQNIYGQTKLAGEKAILAINPPHLIFRTSWIYGLCGKNFLLTMQKLAKTSTELKIVADQIGAPTWSRMVAESTAQICAQALRCEIDNLPDFWETNTGIYHLTASGQTSWHGFAEAIFRLDPNPNQSQNQSQNQNQLPNLIAIPSSQYPTPAKRPAYSVLDTQKITQKFGLQLPDWQKTLAMVLEKIN